MQVQCTAPRPAAPLCAPRLPKAQAPAHIADAIRAKQARDLDAVRNSPVELLAYALMQQDSREQTARREFAKYQLYAKHGGYGVVNPDGRIYARIVNDEGVKVFPRVPDQAHVSAINYALRALGLAYRVETKHAMILHCLERAAAGFPIK